MANTKQKPAPEGAKRSPGKSKFSIPRKDAPPVDGSYLDRLFADYDKQTKELAAQGTAPAAAEEVSGPAAVAGPGAKTHETPAAAHDARPMPRVGPLPSPEVESAPTEVEESAARRPAPAAPAPEAPERVAPAESIPGAEARPRPAVPADDALLLENLKKKHRLGKGEVKVLRAMLGMCRAADANHCYLKIPRLMVDSNLKERQTQLVLRNLRELGLIEKLADYSNADRLGTKYRLTFIIS